jgi:predicted house-cleaning noncanonical NTP pyrophosphatase (MazG superfamily)
MKLVRDKIPEITTDREFIKLSEEGYTRYLNEKLIEEATEYNKAISKESRIEELADVLEVFYAILDNEKIYLDELEEIRLKKLGERGGFEKKIALVK